MQAIYLGAAETHASNIPNQTIRSNQLCALKRQIIIISVTKRPKTMTISTTTPSSSLCNNHETDIVTKV
jgi:hypothetical protein